MIFLSLEPTVSIDWHFVSFNTKYKITELIKQATANVNRHPCNSIISSKIGKYFKQTNDTISRFNDAITNPIIRIYGRIYNL